MKGRKPQNKKPKTRRASRVTNTRGTHVAVTGSRNTVTVGGKKPFGQKKVGLHKHLDSGHGHRFFTALTNPFHDSCRGCHTIDELARPSFKATGKSRAILTIPANSRIMLFPVPSCGSDTPAFFAISGLISAFSATNAYFTYSTPPAGLTYSTYVNAALPFSQATLYSGGTAWRNVTNGYKVRYTGTVLNRGGTAMWYEPQDGLQGIFSGYQTTNGLLNDMFAYNWSTKPQSRFVSFNNKDEHDFVYSEQVFRQTGGRWNQNYQAIFSASDVEWNAIENNGEDVRFGSATTGQYTKIPRAVLVLQNTTASSNIEFTLEYINHSEYNGGTVVPMHTPSPVHVQDAREVANAVVQSKATHAQTPDVHPATHAMTIFDQIGVIGENALKQAASAALSTVTDPTNIERALSGLAGMFF